MKKALLLLIASIAGLPVIAQEFQQDVKSFTKVIASPRVNLILQKGDKESVRLVYENVSRNKINIEVRGKTLSIFLDKARKVEKPSSSRDRYHTLNTMMYEGVSITAYVTYKNIEALEIRGNQELTCHGAIDTDDFRLKAYGENRINLAALRTGYFKTSLYGENTLNIKNGRVVEQKYKLYGVNRIDTRDVRSAFTSASIFGEGRVRINSSEEVRLDAFGEPSIHVDGGATINKRLVFGRTNIHR